MPDQENNEAVGPEIESDAALSNSDSFLGDSSNRTVPAASELTDALGMAILKSGRKILIVDDEMAIADTLALIFKSQHYQVRVAYSAEAAIEVIAEWQPSLAIIDVILPRMNGIDLAIVTKSNYPDCHILLFSGHANTAMLLEEAGKKGHQFEVLAKPVHPSLMLERASALLDGPEEPAWD